MDSGERRRSQRVMVNETVLFRRADGATVAARCENLSLGGMAVLMPTRLYAGQRLALKAPFLGDDLAPLSARVGYVIGLSYPPGTHRIGLAFEALTTDQEMALESYLDAHSGNQWHSRARLLNV
jgi:c-di-GMP-binding flagellar brake protein YcgR